MRIVNRVSTLRKPEPADGYIILRHGIRLKKLEPTDPWYIPDDPWESGRIATPSSREHYHF